MNDLITIETKKELVLTGQKTYDKQIELFNRRMKGCNIDLHTVKEYIDKMSHEKSSSTVNLIKSALKKGVLNTYRKEAMNIIFLNEIDKAFKDMKINKADKKVYLEKVLNEKEIRTLTKKASKRTGLFIEMLNNTGLRISEMIDIKLTDCKLGKGFVYISILGKGKKERRVFIPESLFDSIKGVFLGSKYLFETKNGKKYIRQYVYKEVRKVGEKALKKRVTPHRFRHSFATKNIKKRGSVKAVSLYLGHSDTSITESMYHHDELKPEDLFDKMN